MLQKLEIGEEQHHFPEILICPVSSMRLHDPENVLLCEPRDHLIVFPIHKFLKIWFGLKLRREDVVYVVGDRFIELLMLFCG